MPAITGEVRRAGEPAGGVYVRLYGPSGEFVAEEYTRDDGRFAFHVVDGEWKLEARAAGADAAVASAVVAGGDVTLAVDLD